MKRLRVAAMTAIVILVALAGPARADDLFERAYDDYAARRYDDAVTKYETLLRRGLEHPDVYYNLGNAYFRAGQLGRAMLNYERALRMDPSHGNAKFNLKVAHDAVAERFGRDEVEKAASPSWWARIGAWQPLATLLWLLLAVDVLFFGLLVAVRFLSSGPLRSGLITADVLSGVAGLVVGVLLVARLTSVENVPTSIIIADEVVMREDASSSSGDYARLHAGLRVVKVGERNGWWRIRLANNTEGWVPQTAVEEI